MDDPYGIRVVRIADGTEHHGAEAVRTYFEPGPAEYPIAHARTLGIRVRSKARAGGREEVDDQPVEDPGPLQVHVVADTGQAGAVQRR